LRIDFGQEIGEHRELLKAYLDVMVAVVGVAIEEFENAPWQFESNAAVVKADLSDGSLSRLMSVALMPLHASDPKVTPTASGVKGEIELIATRRYYQAITFLLNDLEKQNKKASDYRKTAQWYENFAKKIDQLPEGDVDPDMQKYGDLTANKLRSIAQSLRGVPMDLSVAAAGLDVRVGVWQPNRRTSGAYVSSNSADVMAKQAEAIARDAKQRDQVWGSMANDRRQISRQMREKFKVDFDAVGK
jgi:hypothetical protein